MMGFTTNQWAVLGLVLVLGWIAGLMSRSGGARWRAEAAEERKRREAADARLEGAKQRIAELERADHHPVTAGTAAAIGAAASGARDDLAQIKGVGRSGETRLNELGYFRYRDIAELSANEAAALEAKLGAEPGTIDREQWREQAGLLEGGQTAEHSRRWS